MTTIRRVRTRRKGRRNPIRTEYPRVRTRKKSRDTYYDVDCRKKGWTGKLRLSFTNKSDALEKAREIGEIFKKEGLNGINKTSEVYTNREIEEWNRQLRFYNKTIKDAVGFYLDHLNKKCIPVAFVETMADQWFQYVAADKKKERGKRTIQEIKIFAPRFGKDFKDIRIDEVDNKTIEKVIDRLKGKDGKTLSQQTKRNYLTKLKQFFNWCIKEGVIEKNPAEHQTQKVYKKDVTVFTIEECKRLLRIVQEVKHQPLMGIIVLGLFAGLRPSEAERLAWENITDSSEVSILSANTKTGCGRRVELNETAKKWFQQFRLINPSWPFVPADLTRRLKRFRQAFALDKKWINNGLRHSYATYSLAKDKNYAALAVLMGNSEAILKRHYVRAVNRQDSKEFWNLEPTTDNFFVTADFGVDQPST